MSNFDDVVKIPGEDPNALDEVVKIVSRKAIVAPAGWEPGIAWDGEVGTLTTGPVEGEPDSGVWGELIADWNLDPATTEIVPGSVQVRGWDSNVGGGEIRRLRYYRATIRAKQEGVDRVDVDVLCAVATRKSKRKTVENPESNVSLVVALSDWQIGKGEGGGTEGTVERICQGIDAIGDKVKEMKRKGRPPEAIYLLGMGDTVENCSGFYPMMEFQVDLDRREQKRVARRLWMRAIDVSVGLAERVVIAGIPGNHGENRKDGKAFTTWTDNDDLAVIEECAEICQVNPARYGNVTAVLARDLTLVLGVSGVNVGLAHGHQFKGSGHSAAKAEKWWTSQIMGRQPVADADILISGHFHHFVVSEGSGRTWIQCPAQDGGSYWWTAQSGQHSPAGQLMFGVGTGYGVRGWGDIEILG